METIVPAEENETNYWYSDPTYEAWKQRRLEKQGLIYAHSDPTYEAWKQFIGVR